MTVDCLKLGFSKLWYNSCFWPRFCFACLVFACFMLVSGFRLSSCMVASEQSKSGDHVLHLLAGDFS